MRAPMPVRRARPERINFAISRRCAVACAGCYSLFGQADPPREPFLASARAFADLGLTTMTLSGGDPLLLDDLPGWLAGLRAAGVRTLKLDTVGVGLLAPERDGALDAAGLLNAVDQLAIALDGWDNASAQLFRRGRPDLHDRIWDLLRQLDALARPDTLIINTVVHAGNVHHLQLIAEPVLALRTLAQWNLFQYTPTDQAAAGANDALRVSDADFAAAALRLDDQLGTPPALQWRSNADRLGHYLLVNSDGEAWLPRADGITHRLGCVFGREAQVLDDWADAVARLAR